MQVSVESTTDLERRLTVEVPKEGLLQKISERLDTLKGQVSVDGFRPGKVPLDVVRSKFGARVEEEVFSEAVKESLQKALGQEQLEPVGEPAIDIDRSSTDSVLRYSATFEVMPQVDVQPVEQIELVRPRVEITEADVDKLIQTLRTQRLLWKPAGRSAQAGDRVTVNYHGTVDGQEFAGAVAQDLPVVIGEGSLIPGFEDQLIGMMEGETKKVEVMIPEAFPAAECRGKTAVFNVRILQVEQPQLPELNEPFFRSFGVREGGLGAFREQIRRAMQKELEQKILGTLKTAMLAKLLEMHVVSVPKTLVQLEIERMKSVAADDPGAPMSDDDLASQARYRVSGGILLTALAKKLGIVTTSEMVRKKIESLAESYENPDEVIAWYYSSQEQLASAESMVTEELLVDYVLEHGQVTDRQTSFAEMMEG